LDNLARRNTPGSALKKNPTLKGLNKSLFFKFQTIAPPILKAFQGSKSFPELLEPRVARSAQPWANLSNTFGVQLKRSKSGVKPLQRQASLYKEEDKPLHS
jgi:hypothetical protein